MILVGFLCVLGAIGLLLAGLAQGDPHLIWASITASAVGGLAVGIAGIQRSRAQTGAPAAEPCRKKTWQKTTDHRSDEGLRGAGSDGAGRRAAGPGAQR